MNFNYLFQSFKLILSLFMYNDNKPPKLLVKTHYYNGVNNMSTPVKVIISKKDAKKNIILYPGASPAGEDHPKMDMLGRLLSKLGFTVYIPRIPPLKKLNITETNIEWFISFYKWILDNQKVNPNKILMIGISYGGAIMLRSVFDMDKTLPKPKTMLCYGTFSNGQTMLNFLINGELIINGKKFNVTPHEWGLIVIFHNFLNNLQLDWEKKDLLKTIEYRINEDMELCESSLKQLPEFQKILYKSIIDRNINDEVKDLTNKMIENEKKCLEHLSPINWANQIENKVFIIHGANDSMVPYTESIKLAKVLPNSELFISYLYEHNEISTNRGVFFISKEIIRLIIFYYKLFKHYGD